MQSKQCVLLLLITFCVSLIHASDELVYFYGEPYFSSETGFVRIEPKDLSWNPTARGFATKAANLEQNINGVAFASQTEGIVIYGEFHVWNNDYVGGLLWVNPETLEVSSFGASIQGKEVTSALFLSDEEFVVAGAFSGFVGYASISMSWVGICNPIGEDCSTLGQFPSQISTPQNLIAIDRQLYIMYQTSASIYQVAWYDYSDSNLNNAWNTLLTFTCDFCSLVEYQGNPWVFGAKNSNGSYGAYQYENGTWSFYETQNIYQLTNSAISVSPDGQSIYLQQIPSVNSSTFYKWNDADKSWDLWTSMECVLSQFDAFNSGIIITCDSSILIITDAQNGPTTQLVSESMCANGCPALYVDATSSFFLLTSFIQPYDTTSVSLSTYSIATASSLTCCQNLTDVEELVLSVRGMCIYGDKIFFTGGFEAVDDVKTPHQMALWDQSKKYWSSVAIPYQNTTVEYCYCDTDGEMLAAVCQTEHGFPILITDYASNENLNKIGYNILNDTGDANYASAVAVQQGTVFFAASTASKTSISLFDWTQKTGSSYLSSISGASVSSLEAVGDILFVGGSMKSENATIRIAEFNTSNHAWIIPDHILPEQNSSVHSIDYCSSNNLMYVGGDFEFAGSLRAHNIAGYSLNGTAVNSTGNGLPTGVPHVICTGNDLYLVYYEDGCPEDLYAYCGVLVSLDLTTQVYSYPIALGASAIAKGADIDQPDEDSSSGLSTTSKVIILASLIAAGGGIILSVICIGVKAGAKKYSRRFYQEISDKERAQLALTDINFETERFEIKNVLGRGTFGTVSSCTFPNRQAATFAVKKIILSKGDKETTQAVQNEIELLKRLRHPNIAHFLGSRMSTSSSSVEFSLFMELYEKPSSLKDVIAKKLEIAEKRKFPEWFSFEEVRKFMRQISDGLHYLHDQGVAHSDLKTANILVRTEGNSTNIKSLHIADFGISKLFDPGNTGSRLALTVVGSLGFMAPEILREEPNDPLKADIWAFGIVVFEILTWQEPLKPGVRPEFSLSHPLSQFNKQFERVVEIFNECTEENPNKRPTCEELFHQCSDM